MSIPMLRRVAQQRLPLNVSDDDVVDELRVLMAAGLIAGLRVTGSAKPDVARSTVTRVLAVTPDGRRLLKRTGAEPLTRAS